MRRKRREELANRVGVALDFITTIGIESKEAQDRRLKVVSSIFELSSSSSSTSSLPPPSPLSPPISVVSDCFPLTFRDVQTSL